MELLSAIAKIIGLILVCFVIFFFGLWFLAFFGVILLFFGLLWALGVPITIKENGVKTGYVRWFTFYRKK